MRQFNNNETESSLFREIFLKQLPPSSRQILAVLGDDIDIDILALRANNIIQQQQAINVTTKPNNALNKNQDNQDIYPDKKGIVIIIAYLVVNLENANNHVVTRETR